jgi:hypothetical protein
LNVIAPPDFSGGRVRIGRPGCGHKEFKRPPETSAATARDYSTTFPVACKPRSPQSPQVRLSVITEREQKKEEFEEQIIVSGRLRELNGPALFCEISPPKKRRIR